MEKIHILPQTIFKFRSSEELLQDTLSKVKNLEWKSKYSESEEFNCQSVDNYLHKSGEFSDLTDWFNESILWVKHELEYSCTQMKITQCWANKTENGEGHHPHSHPNSVLSGIYYLNDSSASTKFGCPSKWDVYNPDDPLLKTFEFFLKDDYTFIFDYVKAEKGTLIIFPSNLEHTVDPNEDTSTRYTISFNTFPSGEIGNLGYLAGFYIDVK